MTTAGSSGLDGRLPRPVPIVSGQAALPPAGEVERRGSEKSVTLRAQVRAAVNERRLGTRLEQALDGVGFVLHHRVVDHSSAPVDHLIVAPTGVWAVHAVHSVGGVSVDAGAHVVRVGGEGSTFDVVIDAPDNPTVDAIGRAAAAVGYDWATVRQVVCFTRASLRRDRKVAATLLTTPRRLVKAAIGPGPMPLADVHALAAVLNTRFPPVSGHDGP